MAKAVIFDWGGTCSIGNHTELLKNRLAEKFGLAPDRVHEAVERNNKAYLRGEIRGEDFFFQLSRILKISFTVQDFSRTFDYVKLNFRVLDLVRACRNRAKTGLLSDNYKEMVDFIRKKITLSEYFDAALFSNETGVTKPEARAFELICSKLRVQPPDCIFVDDTEANVFTARNMGMQAFRFEGAERLEQALQAAGVL